VVRDRDLRWYIRHTCCDDNLRVRLKAAATDEVIAVVRSIDPSAWEDVRAPQERNAVVAPYQKHFERVFAPEKDDRGGGNRSGDAHRFVYIPVAPFVLVGCGGQRNETHDSHEHLRRRRAITPPQPAATSGKSEPDAKVITVEETKLDTQKLAITSASPTGNTCAH